MMTVKESQLIHRAHLKVVAAGIAYDKHNDKLGLEDLRKAERAWMALLERTTEGMQPAPTLQQVVANFEHTAQELNRLIRGRSEA